MKILITGALEKNENIFNYLESKGFEVDILINEYDNPVCYDYDVIICNALFMHHKIEKFMNLKYIQLTSVGYDRVPLQYIYEHNIFINNAGDIYSIPISEYVIGSILQLYKKFDYFYDCKKTKIWKKDRNIEEINGKIITIVGCGNICKEITKRLKGFEVLIYGIDRKHKKIDGIKEIFFEDSLKDLLKISDIVILTMPFTKENYNFFNSSKMKMMKKNSMLINVSRGGILDYDALIVSLKKGNIKYAVLDVFKEEPLNFNSELWNCENVIITPHNAFISNNNVDRLHKLVIENFEKWMKKNN